MYSSFYNMPRNPRFMYPRRNSFGFRPNRFNNNFAIPFLLGGITGAVFSNQPFYSGYPNNYYNNYFYPPYPYYPYYY